MKDNRSYAIRFTFVIIGCIFLIKLFFIQVLDENYQLAAENNVMQRLVDYPYRGLVYDRNNKLIVYNNPVYDLMVVPREVTVTDKTELCKRLGITPDEFDKKLTTAQEYSWYRPSIFLKQLSNQDFAGLQDLLVDYPGFYIIPRTVRAYPYGGMANALGYIGEVSKGQLERDTSNYYRQGDYIGISGLESKYEEPLRGKRGVKYRMVNVRGLEKGSFKNGRMDTLPQIGENLMSTIDIDLQEYGETLMEGKVGSIVAIEPASGEILSFVSAPSYDPNLLTGRNYSKYFSELQRDTLKPLYTRPLMAMYRPGSIFKIIQALVALEEGVIQESTRLRCNRNIIGCHGPHSYENLQGAITHSCNPYFVQVSRKMINQGDSEDTYEDTRIGLERWRKHVASFGLGAPIGIDLPNEKGGMIPNVDYYDRAYNSTNWKFSNIQSIAIGEGENLVVPLQMANFAAIVANRGYYIKPHLIKSIGESGQPLPEYQVKHYTTVDSKYFNVAVEAMAEVVRSGTGQYRAKLADIEVCGKTGTVQNNNRPDHSVFIAFAPKDDPKIALSVYVENGGQGARAAAGIAGLMIEKYLKGCTERTHMEDYILKGDFIY
ncbi:MAG: penicillin-binding transpeptidase domain-containing protein [Cyclobacteriaceae bacterium]|nr:penicillin-binding transpeptidase domain-containing protein [Cyclobacteriaceae bacterium]